MDTNGHEWTRMKAEQHKMCPLVGFTNGNAIDGFHQMGEAATLCELLNIRVYLCSFVVQPRLLG